MGIIITEQTEIKKYFESGAISQSYLKQLLNGIDEFLHNKETEKELFYKEKRNFIIGSAVDTILTNKEEEFEKQYYVSQIKTKPSDTEISIIQLIFNDVKNYLNNIEKIEELFKYPVFVQNSIDKHNWQTRWKTETRINKIIEIGNDYFEDLKRANNRQIISEQELFLIQKIITSLKENPRTSMYFDRNKYRKSIDIDVYYQLPIYFTHKNIECKALLDILFVFKNPDTNKIESIQPIDLKTMYGFTFSFINNVKKWRYDIQAAWYTLAVTYWMNNQNYEQQDYVLNSFVFIVESTSHVGKPLVFEITEELLNIGKSGRLKMLLRNSLDDNILTTLQKEIEGYTQLIDKHIYYSDTGWKEEKIVSDNNGVLKLNWDGILGY